MTEHSLWRFSRALHRAINERQRDDLERPDRRRCRLGDLWPDRHVSFSRRAPRQAGRARGGPADRATMSGCIASTARSIMLGVDSASSMMRYSLTALDMQQADQRAARPLRAVQGRPAAQHPRAGRYLRPGGAGARPSDPPAADRVVIIASAMLNSLAPRSGGEGSRRGGASWRTRLAASLPHAIPPQFCADAPACSGVRHAGGVMTSRKSYGRGFLLMLAGGFCMALALQADAQSRAGRQEPAAVAASRRDPTRPKRRMPPAEAKPIDVNELDWSQLNLDVFTLADIHGAAVRRRQPGARNVVVVQGKGQRLRRGVGEAATVAVLGCRIGADMNVVNQPQTLTSSDLLRQKVFSDSQPSQSSGTAWAAITAPGRRFDLGQDRGRGAGRSLPGAEQARDFAEQVASAQRAVFAHFAERLQCDPAGYRAGARHRRTSVAQLSIRPVGEIEHRRYRHQFCRQPVALVHRRQMASQDRRRAEIVRRRQHLRLDRRDLARRRQQEPHCGIQAELVAGGAQRSAAIPMKDRALPQIGRDAVKIGSPDGMA